MVVTGFFVLCILKHFSCIQILSTLGYMKSLFSADSPISSFSIGGAK